MDCYEQTLPPGVSQRVGRIHRRGEEPQVTHEISIDDCVEEHTVTVTIPLPPEGLNLVRIHLEGEAERTRELAERSDLPEGFRANLDTMAEYYDNYAAWLDQVQHNAWRAQS
jgi:hypothetical protein